MASTTSAPAKASLLRGYGYAAALVVAWVGFSLAGRHAALGGGVRLTPWDLAALRYAVAGPVTLVLFLAGAGRGLPWRRSVVTALVAGLAFPLPSYLGFTYAPAAHGAVILSGVLPFLVAAGARLVFHEAWTSARLASLAVLLAGILLLGYEAYVQGARPGAWRGDLLFLAACVSWACYTILARLWAATPAQAIVAVGLWCSALYLPVWFLFLPSTLATAPAGEIAFQAVFQGGIAVFVSLFLFTRAVALVGTGRLTTITALVPGLAGVLAVPVLGEHIGLVALAGLALVCAAVALGVKR